MLRKSLYSFLLFVLVFTGQASVIAAGETPDPSFAQGGKVLTDFNGLNDRGYAAALQPDGKIVVAGSSFTGMEDDFALARYLPDGDLDPDFGIEGKVTTDLSNDYLLNINTASVTELEALPGVGPVVASRIVEYRTENGPFATIQDLLRVSGVGPMLMNGIQNLITVGTDVSYAVALQPNGKILVAGDSSSNFGLARYHSNGSLDHSFDGDGKVITDFGLPNDAAFSVAAQTDGRIVVSGWSNWSLALARYNSDGSPDTSFDGDGRLTLDFGSGENYNGVMALQPDGKILLAGQTYVFGVGYVFAIARFHPDGSLDASFDGDGKVTTDFPGTFDDGIAAVVVQPDGKIVVAGGIDLDSDANTMIALVRYHSDGSLDASFDGDGRVTTDISPGRDLASAMILAPDGRILVSGVTGSSFSSSDNDFVLARYNTDGSLDSAFDMDGTIVTDFGYGADYSRAVLMQPDGKILAAGLGYNGTDDDFAVARYEVATVIEVVLDIRPGSSVNPIQLKSAGTIPVAILSTAEFNAPATVDRSSLTFGRTGEEPSLVFCNRKGTDIDHDGLPDLLCHFRTRLTGFRRGDSIGILHGNTLDGLPIVGQDIVRILK